MTKRKRPFKGVDVTIELARFDRKGNLMLVFKPVKGEGGIIVQKYRSRRPQRKRR